MQSRCDVVGDNGTGDGGMGDDRDGAPLRGSSTAAPGKRATPHVVSGLCVRGVTGINEFLE